MIFFGLKEIEWDKVIMINLDPFHSLNLSHFHLKWKNLPRTEWYLNWTESFLLYWLIKRDIIEVNFNLNYAWIQRPY
jgi:hypothetical protein